MGKYIEKMPPRQTGDTEKDLAAILEYLSYLREQENFLISRIYKAIESGGENG